MGGRAVLRGLGRDAVLLVRIGQRAAQIGLAPARLRRLGLRQGSLLHRDVRLDAERLDGAAGWCEIARGGQAHGAAEPEWNDGLHRALPEGLGAHHDGRRWSCSAPATISDAEAEPPLISTTTGRPSARSPGVELTR